MIQKETMETTITTKTDNIETVTSTNNNVENNVEAVNSTSNEKIKYFVQPEELKEVMKKTLPSSYSLDFNFETDYNFLRTPVKETDWLIANFVPQQSSSNNKVTMFQAKPGIGKTTLCSYIAILLSTNKRLFSSDYFKISNPLLRPVFIIELEEGLPHMHKLAKKQYEGLIKEGELSKNDRPNILRWCSDEMFQTPDGASYPVLETACYCYEPIAIILDSSVEFTALMGCDTNSSTQYLNIIHPLRKIAQKLNISLFFISHPNKSMSNKQNDLSIAGSFAMVSSAKCVFNLARNEQDHILLTCAKNNYISSVDREKVFELEQTENFTFKLIRTIDKTELAQQVAEKKKQQQDKRKAMFEFAYNLKYNNSNKLSWEEVVTEINKHEQWLDIIKPYNTESLSRMIRRYFEDNPKPVINIENTNNTTNNSNIENTNVETNITNNICNHYDDEKSSISNNTNNTNADVCDDKSDYEDTYHNDYLDDLDITNDPKVNLEANQEEKILERSETDFYDKTYAFKDRYLLNVGDVLDITTYDTMIGNVYNNDVEVCEVNEDNIILETCIGERLTITDDIDFKFKFKPKQIEFLSYDTDNE